MWPLEFVSFRLKSRRFRGCCCFFFFFFFFLVSFIAAMLMIGSMIEFCDFIGGIKECAMSNIIFICIISPKYDFMTIDCRLLFVLYEFDVFFLNRVLCVNGHLLCKPFEFHLMFCILHLILNDICYK